MENTAERQAVQMEIKRNRYDMILALPLLLLLTIIAITITATSDEKNYTGAKPAEDHDSWRSVVHMAAYCIPHYATYYDTYSRTSVLSELIFQENF